MEMTKIKTFVISGVFCLLLAFPVGCGAAPMTSSSTGNPVELNLCAGVGLTDVMTDINGLYMLENGDVKIAANFASSGTLQQQIEQGAPADIFFSPGVIQMDALQAGGLILDETRRDLLHNSIVLVAGRDNQNIMGFMDLLGDDVSKIAIGDPESVPAGTFGRMALDRLGIFERVQPKLILCNDVRQVLSYVEAGYVDAGLVYATDAAITDNVKVVADAPAEVNKKIVYPVAVIKTSTNAAAAKAYIAFLTGAEAKAVFEKYGFIVVQK